MENLYMIRFNDFIQLLYSYLGGNQKHSQFLIHIVSQIMEDAVSNEDKQLDADDKYNPLAKLKPNSLDKIFSGINELPAEKARLIVAHIDKIKFQSFMSKLSNDTLDRISKDLEEKGIKIGDTIDETCADIFESILLEIAQKKRTRQSKTKKSTLTSTVPLQNLKGGAQLSIPKECKVCLYCQNWEGNVQSARKSVDGVYGTCIINNSKMRSTGKESCTDFKPNYSRITSHTLCKD